MPGILNISLDVFAAKHDGEDVKLSIDCKKLALGYGQMGDEDLAGFECPPTLCERKNRHSNEVNTLHECSNILQNASLSKPEVVNDLSTVNSSLLKAALLASITHMSYRTREQLIVKKNSIVTPSTGDWDKSKLAPAISFCHTKIIQSQKNVSDLLQSFDKLGYAVACINGTYKQYVLGCKTLVSFDNQSNYVCLKKLIHENETDNFHNAHITKQKSDKWFELRRENRITGSTIFRAIGMNTLKEQQEHYDKVFKGIEKPVSKALQSLFDYGSNNEIHALATLLGKILPVYYPHLTFIEDGCEILHFGDTYVVISRDGSGVNENNQCKVAFEFKCPKTGKERVTDVHYDLPVYHTTTQLNESQ